MFKTAALFICLLACALGQDTATITSMGLSQTSSTAAPTRTTSHLPTVSLFLPVNAQEYVQASVISASPNQTAYALGCHKNVTTSRCGFDPSITVTEGVSSFIMTESYALNKTTLAAEPLTVRCALVGAAFNETPHIGATSAVCTNSSAISGLGEMGSTSTLASTEINYFPVTITAGYEKLIAAATMTSSPSSTSSSAATIRNAAASLGLGSILALAVLGLV